MTDAGVVIGGAGQAGFQVAFSLRELGYAGAITMVGDEPHLPYQRPPLSKAYLMGAMDEGRLALRAERLYAEKRIDVRTGARLAALDRNQRKAVLEDGSVLPYGHFVFALGARNRALAVPGSDLAGVHYLRTLGDAQALKAAFGSIRNVVVIGAGFIGLEFAAVAAKHGLKVTVIEVADRPMARALSPQMGAVFTREHERSGVRFLFGEQVLSLAGEGGRVQGVATAAHGIVPAELVLVGIGVLPNAEIAGDAGLEVRNGIVVDAHLATADPAVSAIGDCAAHPNVHGGGQLLRLESVQNAIDQGKCVAARITGQPAPYQSVPWFWSDQGALKLQIAGLTQGFDRAVLRGDPAGTSFSVFCYRGGQLLGVESVNRAGEHMAARKLLGQRAALHPDQAADESYDLKAHLAAEGA
jgi:3-phenylpropionate/trans-cinnamate dioxygenase ferredoxin reductase subunit